MSSILNETRKTAALESKGSSSEMILDSIVKEIQSTTQTFSKVLDIGCGQGDLLLKIESYNHNIELHGIDYLKHENLDESKIKFQTMDCNTSFSAKLEKFDLVTSSEVIEHLENGRSFIREIGKILNKGGYLILTTPNIESFTSLLSFYLKGYHSSFGPKEYPAHINSFSEYEIKNIVNEIPDLEIEKIFYIKNGRIPATSFKWHRIFPFLRGKRFSDNFLIVIKKI